MEGKRHIPGPLRTFPHMRVPSSKPQQTRLAGYPETSLHSSSVTFPSESYDFLFHTHLVFCPDFSSYPIPPPTGHSVLEVLVLRSLQDVVKRETGIKREMDQIYLIKATGRCRYKTVCFPPLCSGVFLEGEFTTAVINPFRYSRPLVASSCSRGGAVG